MVKLVRNLLQAYVVILSPDGPIEWQLIRDLNSTQEDIGLQLGSKVKSTHIDFQSQKIQVSLAVQTLSVSVASAMLTLLKLGVSKFLSCGLTGIYQGDI